MDLVSRKGHRDQYSIYNALINRWNSSRNWPQHKNRLCWKSGGGNCSIYR